MGSKLRYTVISVFFFSCVNLLPGCTMLGVAKVSEPWVTDVGNADFKKDILFYSDISISVKPQNYYTSLVAIGPIIPIIPAPGGPRAFEKYDFFVVVVQFETKGNGYTFDPNRVILKYIDDIYRPISVAGPFIGGGDVSALEVGSAVPGHPWRCLRPKTEIKSGLSTRDLVAKECFELEFRIRPIPPAENFSLELIGSVHKDGAALPLPTFKFRPASRTKFGIMAN